MTSAKKSVRSIWPPPPWEVGLSVQLGNFISVHFVLEQGWDLFWRGGGAGTGLPNLNKPCQNCWTLCEVYMPNLLFVIYLELIKKFSLVGGGWVVVDTTVNIVICFGRKILDKRILCLKNSWTKIYLWTNIFLNQNFLGGSIFFQPKNFFDLKFFWSKHFWEHN